MSKVLAYIESRDNKIKNAGFETASTAVKIGKEISADVEALLIGDNLSEAASSLGEYGITQVTIVEDSRLGKYSTTAYAKIIAEITRRNSADIIFLSATAMGKDVAPRVSAKLEAGVATDCTELKVEGGEIIATRPVYAGKSYIDMKVTSAIKIYSLRPNVFKAEKESVTCNAERVSLRLSTCMEGSAQSSVVMKGCCWERTMKR